MPGTLIRRKSNCQSLSFTPCHGGEKSVTSQLMHKHLRFQQQPHDGYDFTRSDRHHLLLIHLWSSFLSLHVRMN